jgi:hypothetical protein
MTDELYQVPLGEFTTARDALAARLKAAGDKTAAAEAKRARKPSVAAWAANQVVWHARDEWQRLQTATQALREKHEKAALADELRQAGRLQREALLACESRASELLEKHGHAASPAILQKVGHTLLALAYGAPDATPGRLDHELQAPGFEALAGMTLVAPVPAGATPADGNGGQTAPKRAAQKAAEARLADARRAVLKARARLATEEERCAAVEKQVAAARQQRDEARRRLDAAEAEEAAAKAALD